MARECVCVRVRVCGRTVTKKELSKTISLNEEKVVQKSDIQPIVCITFANNVNRMAKKM